MAHPEAPRALTTELARALRAEVAPHLGGQAGRAHAGAAPGGDVTFEIDERAEAFMERFLAARAPEVAFYSEDRGLVSPSDQAEWVLVVDPIDGTRPAIAGLAEAAWLEGWPAGDVASVSDRLMRTLAEARTLQVRWAIGELAFWLDRLGHGPIDATGAAAPFAATLAGDHRTAAERWTEVGCPYEAARR